MGVPSEKIERRCAQLREISDYFKRGNGSVAQNYSACAITHLVRAKRNIEYALEIVNKSPEENGDV